MAATATFAGVAFLPMTATIMATSITRGMAPFGVPQTVAARDPNRSLDLRASYSSL